MASEQEAAFISVTGASQEEAARYLQMANGDTDVAVVMYLEREDEPSQQAEPVQGPGAGAVQTSPASQDAVQAIVGIANQSGSEEPGPGARPAGKGAGKGREGPAMTVRITFFGDGFAVEEVDEKEEAEEAPKPKAAAAPRRTGMMTLEDLSSSGPAPELPQIPELPPLRPYAGSEAFLDALKQNRVPEELQRRDADGEPVAVTVAVADLRPKTYAELEAMVSQLKAMRAKAEAKTGKTAMRASGPALFGGAGQSLSASASVSASASNASAEQSDADRAIVAIATDGSVVSLDETKPITTIQVRMASGARRIRLNHDHTVADLWRAVATEFGASFKSKAGHQLVAGFPPKPLTDFGASLKAADLINAAVTHRCS